MKPRFKPGAEVRVNDIIHTGHRRTPVYVRGKVGRVERVAGKFLNPEQLAYGYPGLPAKTLYRVRFRQHDVWPGGYAGSAADTIEVEIYEHWLSPADSAD